MSESYLSPTPITHEVNGKEIEFFAVSLTLLFKLRNLARPISEALAVMFEPHPNDVESSSIKDGDAVKSEVGAISPTLAAQRTADRERSVGRCVEALLDQKNGEILAELILDSIRDREAPRPKKADVEAFMDKLTAPIFLQHVVGMVLANVKVFGPVGESLALAARGAVAKVTGQGEGGSSSN